MIIIITEKPAVLYLQNKIFDLLQLKQISSNAPDFLKVNSALHNLKGNIRNFQKLK